MALFLKSEFSEHWVGYKAGLVFLIKNLSQRLNLFFQSNQWAEIKF